MRINADRISRSMVIALSFCLIAVIGMAQVALAAAYPAKPINFIIQFPAGSTTDIIGRKVANQISQYIGQPVVAMNSAGGGGTVGVAELARSKPDGYTIGCATTPTIAIIPHLQNLPYDPFKDIIQVCSIHAFNYGIYVKGDAPWKTFEELVEFGRANPGKWRNAHAGPGTTDHLVSVRIARKLNLDVKQVPYKGHIDCIAPVLGGHVESAIGSPAVVMPHIKSGKLRLLLVTSKDRWPSAPEIPTVPEKGFDFWQTSNLSIIVPAKTPKEIRGKLSDLFRKVSEEPQLNKELIEDMYVNLSFMTGDEYTKLMEEQFLFYKDFLKTLGMGSK